MAPTERSPLLPTVQPSGRVVVAPPSSLPTSSTLPSNGSSTPLNSQAGLILTEDDITIEGMVLALLSELSSRGYVLPPGLPSLPDDMPADEADAEIAFLRTVFSGVKRHRDVMDRWVPDLTRAGGTGTDARGVLAVNRPPSTLPSPAPSSYGSTPGSSASSTTVPSRPSPLSSQRLDSTVLTSPSALFLAALLSLLITLQSAPVGVIQETDRGVDGELRMFKARRELGERLYAVVEGLLDSYLVSGDEREEEDEGEDALVTLLFRDFPLNYDSMDRATCALDLLLHLSSYRLIEAEDLVSHPVVLASTEYVWRNGLLPPPRPADLARPIGWKEAFVGLDRFSTPRILHAQTYLLATIHGFLTIYLVMFSSYAHFDAFNPLAPNAPHQPAGHHRPVKTWSVFSALVWYLWVAGTLGWAGEVGRAWFQRGPQSSLPLSPSTLLPLLHHSLVFTSLLIRALAFYLYDVSAPTRRGGPTFLLSTSLSLLAYSIPFFFASRVLPQNLPSFGTPTHLQLFKLRDGRKRRDVGYRPPPKSVPVSHRALRSLEAHLGGLVQFATYFTVVGALLLWSLGGSIDYPGYALAALHLPLALFPSSSSSSASTASLDALATPIEARTTLFISLILGAVLAYFSGGRPSVAPKPLASSHAATPRRELDDLDGWTDRYGREVAFRARRERLAVNRYFTFVPHDAGGNFPSVECGEGLDPARGGSAARRLETLASAFSTPPLPSPLNLFVPPLLLVAGLTRRFVRRRARRALRDAGEGEDEWVANGGLPPGQEGERAARRVQERGRVWAWRVGMVPLGLWAVGAKGWRWVRGRE
ncbi:hypothetical protein JCM10207_005823 [Rhodosporidiobolus poonsookiae]